MNSDGMNLVEIIGGQKIVQACGWFDFFLLLSKMGKANWKFALPGQPRRHVQIEKCRNRKVEQINQNVRDHNDAQTFRFVIGKRPHQTHPERADRGDRISIRNRVDAKGLWMIQCEQRARINDATPTRQMGGRIQ